MPETLHEISRAIGQLQQGQQERSEGMRRIEEKLDSLTKDMRLDRHTARNDLQIVVGEVEKLKIALAKRDQRDATNKLWATTLLAVTGALGGAISAFVSGKLGLR